jgi:hypothetical protein
MYTFSLYTLALSPCFSLPLADPLLLPFLITFTYLETLLAAIGSVHPGPRLLVNWSPHLHPFPTAPHLLPICFPFRNPDPLWFSQVNAPFTKTTSQLWFPRPAQPWSPSGPGSLTQLQRVQGPLHQAEEQVVGELTISVEEQKWLQGKLLLEFCISLIPHIIYTVEYTALQHIVITTHVKYTQR